MFTMFGRGYHMHIQERVSFAIDPATVWKRASDVAKIPDYWHGTRSLKVIESGQDKVVAKTKFAFGGVGQVEITRDDPGRTLLLRYVSGPFKGTQAVKVEDSSIEAEWDIEFTGLFKLASGWNEKHFRSGTVHALERLSAPQLGQNGES